MTKGLKTSEFWLTLAAAIVAALVASGLFGAESIWLKALTALGSILAALGYTASRTYLKAKVASADAVKAAAEATASPADPS